MANSIFLSEERLPRFLESRSTEEKLTEMEDYLYLVSEQLRYMLQNLDERNFNTAGLTRIEAPLYARISDAEGMLRTELELTAGTLRAEMSAALDQYETVSAAAQLLADAELYADGATATLAQQVAANYLANSARAGILSDAASYADGAVSSLSQSVASTYQTRAGMSGYATTAALSTAAANTLASANAHADGAVSTLSQSVAANYLANSARAGIVSEATTSATSAVAQMVLYVEDGNGTSSISINGGTIELNTNITEVNSTLHIGGSGNRYDGEIRLNRYCTLSADDNEDLEIYAGATLMLDAYNEVWLQPGDGSSRIYAGSAGRYWYFDGTGIYWCNANGSIRKSVVLE